MSLSPLPACWTADTTPPSHTPGHKLQEYVMDEAAVLKGISKVYGAKKAAALALLAQEDKAAVGQGGGRQRSKK